MTPVSELPFNVRPKSRKEKNKLASRACRLKKKAQHEANKLKLYGLQREHSKFITITIFNIINEKQIVDCNLFSEQLMSGIQQIKRLITKKITDPNITVPEYNTEVDKVVQDATSKSKHLIKYNMYV